MKNLELIATAAFGLESVVNQELERLGYRERRTENGRITYQGDWDAICRSNLWLRCANRVFLKLGEFPARSFEELFQGVKALPWEEWIPADGVFPVTGKSVKSTLHSIPDCQAIVKKAIVERLKTIHHQDWFPETGARYPVEFSLLQDRAILCLDTSGHGLHRRGYREETGKAPIKETLACGLLYLSHWKPDRVLLDPFCGSGTIPIEAAMMAKNQAPGLRQTFVSETWSQIPSYVWQRARHAAEQAVILSPKPRIYGSDHDYFAIRLAKKHAELAGVADWISFQKIDYAATSSRYQYGYVITNPPYGERLGDRKEAETLYAGMGRHFAKFDTWSFSIISSHPEMERFFGRRADKKRKLYNGALRCDDYQFFGPKPPFRMDGGQHLGETGGEKA